MAIDSPEGFTELYSVRIGTYFSRTLPDTAPYFGVFISNSDGRLFYGCYLFGSQHLAQSFIELTGDGVVKFALAAQTWGQKFESQHIVRGGNPTDLKLTINSLISNTLRHMVDQAEKSARSHEEKVAEAKAKIRRIRTERYALTKEIDQLTAKLDKSTDELNEARKRYYELTRTS